MLSLLLEHPDFSPMQCHCQPGELPSSHQHSNLALRQVDIIPIADFHKLAGLLEDQSPEKPSASILETSVSGCHCQLLTRI